MRAFIEAFLHVELHVYITIAWHMMMKICYQVKIGKKTRMFFGKSDFNLKFCIVFTFKDNIRGFKV